MIAYAVGVIIALGSVVSGLPGGNGHIHSYAGRNAGVYVDLPDGHWCGVELRSAEGAYGVWPFCDVD